MTGAGLIFFLANALALLALPRRWASLPLVAGACYMTLGQGIEIGPLSFPIIRLLVLVGFVRVLFRRERPAGGLVGMDWLMVAWGAWALCSSPFHENPQTALTFRLGFVYNALGVYLLLRAFCVRSEDVTTLIKVTAILLVPVALEMLSEQVTGNNLFAVLGGVPQDVAIRKGRFRAQGPFSHAILAGTVGAVCAPLMVGIWRKSPWVAMTGLAACVAMVIASASSGPLLSLSVSGAALSLWRWRHLTRHMRIAAVVGYILLELVMKAPAYYLIARIDLTGGSTGWHRARLIESAITHFGEWWLAGTDYTRHWMPTGVSWNEDHTDITNYYLKMGVIGGLPLLALFIAVMWCGFRYVGDALRASTETPIEDRFLTWALGASLFAHAATCISVSYFDQSVVFLYLTLAVISSLRSLIVSAADAPAEALTPPLAPAPERLGSPFVTPS